MVSLEGMPSSQTLVPAWLRRVVAKEYRVLHSKRGPNKRASRVVTAWLRRAMEEELVEDLLRKVRLEDLPFDHLFEGKRRVLVDPEKHGGLGAAAQPKSAAEIRKFLLDTKVLDEGGRIDWKDGKIYDANGKVISRLGKALNKGMRAALGKDLPLFVASSKVEEDFNNSESEISKSPILRGDMLRGFAALGQIFDEEFPTEGIRKELSEFRLPSPENWERLKQVAQKFIALSAEERRKLSAREQKRDEDMGSTLPDSARQAYWEARGLFSTYSRGDDEEVAEAVEYLKRWVDQGDKFYHSDASANIRKVHELVKDVPVERRKQLKAISEIGEKKQEFDLWKSLYGDELTIVLSRDPVDVIRMSDHPKAIQAIESCHSEDGLYFQCAIDEAEEGGLVAYVVKKSDVEGRDLEAGELFEDHARGVKGIKPYSRLRLRRFEKGKGENGLEVAIPEQTVYGADFGYFVDAMTSWAREVQPEFFEGTEGHSKNPGDWRLTGGDYEDAPSSELFDYFFDHDEREDEKKEFDPDPYGEGYTHEDTPYQEDEDEERERPEAKVAPKKVHPWRETDQMGGFWEWMGEHNPQVPNPNPRGTQQEITPSTLKGYARGGTSYSSRARETVNRYLARYRKEQEGAEPRIT